MKCSHGSLSGRPCRRKASTTRTGRHGEILHLCSPHARTVDLLAKTQRNAAVRARADRAWKAKHPSAEQCDDIAAAYDLDPQWAFHADYWRDRAERLREGARV